MSKYTREEVIEGRKCGLKYFDRAIEKVGRKEVIAKGIAIHHEFPDTWGGGWANMDWSIGNAVREIIENKNDISMSWNLDEALTPKELNDLKKALNLPNYVPGWERKKSSTKSRGEKKMSKLSTEKLKTMMIGWLTDPVIIRKALGRFDDFDEAQRNSFIKEWSNEKFWKRNQKMKISNENCNVCGCEEEYQEAFDNGMRVLDKFEDQAGEIFARPSKNSIFRDFYFDPVECGAIDSFRVEIITDPTDQEVQRWELCMD